MKKMKTLTLMSAAILTLPIIYSVSCGATQEELYGDGGEQISPIDIQNDPYKFEVVMSGDYAPYNFTLTDVQHQKIVDQSKNSNDLDPTDKMSQQDAIRYLEMINSAHAQTHVDGPYDKHNVWVAGYDVKVAKEIALDISASTGPLDIYIGDFEKLLPTVKAGNADAAIDGITNTPERDTREGVDFSETYYKTTNGLLYDKTKFTNSSQISFERLDNKKLGVQRGTIQAKILHKLKNEKYPDLTIREYDSMPLAITAMSNDQIDAIFCEDIVAQFEVDMDQTKYAMTEFDELTYFNVDENNIAIAVKDKYDTSGIDAAILEFLEDGGTPTEHVNKQVLNDSAALAAWARKN